VADDNVSTRQRLDALIGRQRPGAGRGAAEVLERLCLAACEELALLGAAATLIPGTGAHTVAAASSGTARKVEEAQFGVGEGPTKDAFTDRRPVLVGELELHGGSRWPGWVPVALEAGVTAVYAVPLHVGASIFGVLALYGGAAPRLDRQGLQTVLVLGDLATAILVDGSLPPNGDGLEPGLEDTLGTHASVYQAQGMVMVALGVGLPEALARMRAQAWATDQDLVALAAEIVAGRTMPTRDDR
jgi:hypothetical protein